MSSSLNKALFGVGTYRSSSSGELPSQEIVQDATAAYGDEDTDSSPLVLIYAHQNQTSVETSEAVILVDEHLPSHGGEGIILPSRRSSQLIWLTVDQPTVVIGLLRFAMRHQLEFYSRAAARSEESPNGYNHSAVIPNSNISEDWVYLEGADVGVEPGGWVSMNA